MQQADLYIAALEVIVLNCRIPGGCWAAAFRWNALLCGRRFVVPAVTPVAGHGAEGDW
jgi:hypothetical protein